MKATAPKPANHESIQEMIRLLKKIKAFDEKDALVLRFTRNRTTHMKETTHKEMHDLLVFTRMMVHLRTMLSMMYVPAEKVEEMVKQYSQGQTNIMREMDLDDLQKCLGFNRIRFERMDGMRKKIIALMYQKGWTFTDTLTNKVRPDMKRLDEWLLESGKHKKPLMEHTYEELVNTVTQYELVFTRFIQKQ